jgi:transposase
MAYLTPENRFQLQMRSMEEYVDKDNPVRFIDAFVDQLELAKSGFIVSAVKIEGRPSFDPKVFLKLYFYGYLKLSYAANDLKVANQFDFKPLI